MTKFLKVVKSIAWVLNYLHNEKKWIGIFVQVLMQKSLNAHMQRIYGLNNWQHPNSKTQGLLSIACKVV
jgi:hypothetical protein